MAPLSPQDWTNALPPPVILRAEGGPALPTRLDQCPAFCPPWILVLTLPVKADRSQSPESSQSEEVKAYFTGPFSLNREKMRWSQEMEGLNLSCLGTLPPTSS